MGPGQAAPYAPRPIRFVEVRRRAGWALKLYSIQAAAGPFDWPGFEPGLDLAVADLPEPARAAGRSGAAFLIAHQGGTGDYVVLGWWDRDNELPLKVFVRFPQEGNAWRRASGGESVCVWDLQVIAFERDAYVASHMTGSHAGALEAWEAIVRPEVGTAGRVTLEGEHVRLEPLGFRHLEGLCEAGLDEQIWTWSPKPIRTPEQMREYLAEVLLAQARGEALPFATIERAGGRVAGTTRFGNIDLSNRRVEIGWTWLGRRWQRTAINTEAKLLMLEHAFGTLGCRRVELKTDALNARSRAAILRLGAREEGTLRGHMETESGRVRDSVSYAILRDEWPAVRESLAGKLRRGV